MTDRIDDFLRRHGLADAAREPLPGDASARRYIRLAAGDGRSLRAKRLFRWAALG